MRNEPLISVIMPVHNAQKYLETSIKSVLTQSYKNFQFIIVNDGSSDKSEKLIKRFQKKDKRIIVLHNKKNIGVTKSLNKALRQAKGKYVIRMDADDWSHPIRFKSQVKLMEMNPSVVVSGSYIWVCDEELKETYIRKYHRHDKHIRSRMFRYSPFAHPATIWRTNILKKEKYNEKIRIGQDYELYFRVGKHGDFMNIERPLLKLRMHSKSISSSMNDLQSKATIKIRHDAVKKHGYTMSFVDKTYNFLQTKLIGLIPVKMRFMIFNFLRKFDFF